MPYLILKQEDSLLKSFELNIPVISVGRGPANDINIPDPFVSRDHARVTSLSDGSYEISDLGGRHPLKVNGKVISHHVLQDGA